MSTETEQQIIKRRAHLISVFVILFFSVILFQYSVDIRKSYFGKVSRYGDLTSITAHALVHLQNWYNEGALKLNFLAIDSPPSVELESLNERGIYISYPPGHLLPIHLISRLLERQPTYRTIMYYNLLNHLLFAVALALLSYLFLRSQNYETFIATFLSIIPTALILLLPGSLYFFQNTYFTDIAVMLPYILFVLLKFICWNTAQGATKRWLRIAQGVIFFFGILTDYLFFFLGFVSFIIQIYRGDIRLRPLKFISDTLCFWLPALLATGFYAWQLYITGLFPELLDRFLIRTGLSQSDGSFELGVQGGGILQHIFTFYFFQGALFLGKIGLVIVFLVVLFAAIFLFKYIQQRHSLQKPEALKIQNCLLLLILILVPCLLQSHVFIQHSARHGFATLKYFMALSLGGFIIVPQLCCLFAKTDLKLFSIDLGNLKYEGRKLSSFEVPVLPLLLVLGALSFGLVEHQRYQSFFPASNQEMLKLGAFIKKNLGFKDVLFSDQVEIVTYPPQQLSFSTKLAYKVSSVNEIATKLEAVRGNYRINLLIKNSDKENKSPIVQKLLPISKLVAKTSNYRLFRVDRNAFWSLINPQ